MQEMDRVTVLGQTNGRGKPREFGIRQADRLRHVLVLGRTGVGKSTLLEAIALQDMHAGRGVCVIDPHGDLAGALAQAVPPARAGDLIYLDAADDSQPYGYNPLRRVAAPHIPLAVSGLMETFKKRWGDAAWGVRMEHIFRNALYALIETGDATLPDLLTLLSDKHFRRDVTSRLKNEQVRRFWKEEFRGYNPRYRQEAIAPIQNKVGSYLADPRLYRLLVSPTIDLHFRQIMDEGKMLIVNLAKGRIGDDSSSLLGALLVTTIGLAALSRSDVPEAERRPYFLLIDEFGSFTTLSVANMISELRKFGVGMTVCLQHLHQVEPEVRHAVLGNAGTLISFRIGPDDATTIARELEPTFAPHDLLSLPNHSVYLKLMIDGEPSRPFSADTLWFPPTLH